MDFYVYVWTNQDNGMQYVGKGHGQRAWDHVKRAKSGKTPLNRAMLAHPFSLTFVGGALSEPDALELERRTIAELGTKTPNGYNRTIGGQAGPLGVLWSPERRERAAAQFRGRTPSPLASEAYKALWQDPEARARMVAQRKGRLHTEEAKQKMSDRRRGRPKSPEHIANQAAASRATWARKKAASNAKV